MSRKDFDTYSVDFRERVSSASWKKANSSYVEFKNSHQNILKLNLKRAIDNSELSRLKKDTFNNYVDHTDFISPNEIFADRDRKDFVSLAQRALTICDGRPVAQAADTEKNRASGNQVLIMCNELFLLKSQKGNSTESLGNTFFVGIHELSILCHSIGNPVFIRVYLTVFMTGSATK